MRKLLVVVAFLAAVNAHASSRLDYDRLAGPKQDALASLLVRTLSCMRDAVPARLAAGIRDENAVAQWVVEVCAVPLGRFMVSDMGFTPRDAATYLFAMAHAAIDETPGVKKGR